MGNIEQASTAAEEQAEAPADQGAPAEKQPEAEVAAEAEQAETETAPADQGAEASNIPLVPHVIVRLPEAESKEAETTVDQAAEIDAEAEGQDAGTEEQAEAPVSDAEKREQLIKEVTERHDRRQELAAEREALMEQLDENIRQDTENDRKMENSLREKQRLETKMYDDARLASRHETSQALGQLAAALLDVEQKTSA